MTNDRGTTANDDIDWSLATWEGSRRAQLRHWRRLSLRERLEALDGMREIVEAFADARAARRLRSPATGAGGSEPRR